MPHVFLANESASAQLRGDLYLALALALFALLLPVLWITRLSANFKDESEILEELEFSTAQPRAVKHKKQKKGKRQGEKPRKGAARRQHNSAAAAAATLGGAARVHGSCSESDADGLSAIEANTWSGSECTDFAGPPSGKTQQATAGHAWQQSCSEPAPQVAHNDPPVSWHVDEGTAEEETADGVNRGAAECCPWAQTGTSQPGADPALDDDGKAGGSECTCHFQIGEATAEGLLEDAGLGMVEPVTLAEVDGMDQVMGKPKNTGEATADTEIVAREEAQDSLAAEADGAWSAIEGSAEEELKGRVYGRELMLAHWKPRCGTFQGPPGLGLLGRIIGPPPGLAPPPGLELPAQQQGLLVTAEALLPPPPGLGFDGPEGLVPAC